MAINKALQKLPEEGGRQVFCFQLIQRQVGIGETCECPEQWRLQD